MKKAAISTGAAIMAAMSGKAMDAQVGLKPPRQTDGKKAAAVRPPSTPFCREADRRRKQMAKQRLRVHNGPEHAAHGSDAPPPAAPDAVGKWTSKRVVGADGRLLIIRTPLSRSTG